MKEIFGSNKNQYSIISAFVWNFTLRKLVFDIKSDHFPPWFLYYFDDLNRLNKLCQLIDEKNTFDVINHKREVTFLVYCGWTLQLPLLIIYFFPKRMQLLDTFFSYLKKFQTKAHIFDSKREPILICDCCIWNELWKKVLRRLQHKT